MTLPFPTMETANGLQKVSFQSKCNWNTTKTIRKREVHTSVHHLWASGRDDYSDGSPLSFQTQKGFLRDGGPSETSSVPDMLATLTDVKIGRERNCRKIAIGQNVRNRQKTTGQKGIIGFFLPFSGHLDRLAGSSCRAAFTVILSFLWCILGCSMQKWIPQTDKENGGKIAIFCIIFFGISQIFAWK